MVLRFYPKKDATIYEYYPSRNTGLDAVLELSKIIDNTSSYNSRMLIDFDYNTIESDITSLGYNADLFNWNLKLYSTEEREIPLDYTLECYAISQSWNMGVGRFGNSPQTTEGVSWTYREGLTVPTTAWLTGSYAPGSAGAFDTNPGGGTWYTAVSASQTFSYKSADINMNVNDIVRSVQSGSIPFYGFIIKKQQADETSALTFKSIKFFSKDTHTVHAPVLEAGYDDSVNAGTLSVINTNEEYNILAVNLQTEYLESSTPRIRFSARYRFPAVTFATSSGYLTRHRLPVGSQYAIYSAHTDDVLINFSNYTKISDDASGNYFNLPLESFQPERYYRILLKVPNSGSVGYQIYDKDWIFKVTRNQ